MSIEVSRKGVTCKWSLEDPRFLPWQTVTDWLEERENDSHYGMYAERYEDFLNQIELFADDIKNICGCGGQDGIYIQFAKAAPVGYVHTIEFAAAYAQADEMDYLPSNVLRVWWD